MKKAVKEGVWSLKDLNGDVVWQGAFDKYPSLSNIHRMLSAQSPTLLDEITNYIIQLLQHCPTKALPHLLNCLASGLWCIHDSVEPKKLFSLPNANKRSLCGKPIKKGDIMWVCRECGNDATCVQCDDCFQDSDHTNHEVYFHRASSGGGCCDCGDHEAWNPAGTCSYHGVADSDMSVDPVSVLPPPLVSGIDAVCKGILVVFMHTVIAVVESLNPLHDNHIVDAALESGYEVVVRVHNDDIHTYDEVTGLFVSVGLASSQAAELTVAVDMEGSAVVLSTTDMSRIKRFWDVLAKGGLLVSVIPKSVLELEERLVVALGWMVHLASSNDGLMRLMCQHLLTLNEYICEATAESFIPGMGIAPFPRHFPLRHDPPSNLAPNMLASNSVNGHVARITLPAGSIGAIPERHIPFLKPFNQSHESSRIQLATPRLLALYVCSSPYLAKPLQRALNDMVLLMQQDIMFKMAFSQILVQLYPTLSALFCHGIGTHSESVFALSVQVFTSDSIVRMMSSEGVHTRPFIEDIRDEAKFSIFTTLTSTLRTVLEEAGCTSTRNDDSFLSSFTLRNRRINHICRDIEFVVGCGDLVKDFFTHEGPDGCSALEHWLDVLGNLNFLNLHTRIPEGNPHVQFEDNSWQDAMTLILEVESVTSCILYNIFSPKNNLREDKVEIRSIFSRCVEAVVNRIAKSIEKLNTEFAAVSISPPESIISYEWRSLFNVSSRMPVSVLIPLARFLARLFLCACESGISFDLQSLYRPTDEYMFFSVCTMCEYSLRSLSFSAQVESELWRRNGVGVVNLLYNYNRAPLCRHLRDLDLCTVQLAICWLGPDAVIRNVVNVFEAFGLSESKKSKLRVKFRASMTTEMLRVLILVTSYLPQNINKHDDTTGEQSNRETKEEGVSINELNECSISGFRNSIDKRVAHILLSGNNTLGKVHAVKPMIGAVDFVGDEDVNESVRRLCSKTSPTSSSEPTSLDLLPEACIPLFDPEHPYISKKDLHLANDTVRNHMDKAATCNKVLRLCSHADKSAIPILFPTAVPTCHPEFTRVRKMLYCKTMIEVVTRILDVCIANTDNDDDDSKIPESIVVSMASRCVHLVTLQLHCLSSAVSCNSPDKLPPSNFEAYETQNNVQITPEEVSSHMEYIWRGSESFLQPCSANLEDDVARMLKSLAAVYASKLLNVDTFYSRGLEWVLKEFCSRSEAAKRVISSCGVVFTASSGVEVETDEEKRERVMKARRMAANQKAMDAMRRKAEAFSALIDAEKESDECDDDTEFIPECIICREKTSDPMGYLAYIQPSTLIHNCRERVPDDPREQSMYLVVAYNESLPVYSKRIQNDDPDTVDTQENVIGYLECGEVVSISSRAKDAWVKLATPVVGWAKLYTSVNTATAGSSSYAQRLQLFPLSRLAHARHGRSRPHISACGHALHLNCWDTYCASSLARQINSHQHMAFMSHDTEKGEVICPLCKSISNVALPLYQPTADCITLTHNNGCVDGNDFSLSPLPVSISMDEWTDRAAAAYRSVRDSIDKSTVEAMTLRAQILSESCLTRSQLPWRKCASTSPSFNVNNDIGKFVAAMRTLHATWSATANTLFSLIKRTELSHVDATDPFVSMETLTRAADSGGGTVSDVLVVEQLIRCLYLAPYWLGPSIDFDKHIHQPLHELLVRKKFSSYSPPVKSSSSSDIGECLLLHHPLPVVFDALSPEDQHSISWALNVMKDEAPAPSAWPILRQPLLTQDLTVMAVAYTTSALHPKNSLGYMSLMCIARLLQILLEPVVTGRISCATADQTIAVKNGDTVNNTGVVGSMSIDDLSAASITHGSKKRDSNGEVLRSTVPVSPPSRLDATVFNSGDLDNLRDFVCQVANVPIQSSGPHAIPEGKSLEQLVIDTWLPYLEFICALRLIITNQREDAMPYSDAHHQSDGSRLLAAIHRAGLGHLLDPQTKKLSLDWPLISDAARLWGEQYAKYYEHLLTDQPSSEVGYTMRPHMHSRAHSVSSIGDESSTSGIHEESKYELVQGIVDALHDSDMEIDGDGFLGDEDASESDADAFEMDWLAEVGPYNVELSSSFRGHDVGYNYKRWTLIGVDPPLSPYVAPEFTGAVSFPPALVGSLSGSVAAYDARGKNSETSDKHVIRPRLIDRSHASVGRRHTLGLVDLPDKFTELYKKCKYPDTFNGSVAVDDPAICLVCGCVLSAGNRVTPVSSSGPREISPGECTLHARECGSGTCIFFLVEKCVVVLISGPYAAYFSSIYVDVNGDSGSISGHNKPLFLCNSRYDKVKSIYFRNHVVREVVRMRSGDERVIRQNWY